MICGAKMRSGDPCQRPPSPSGHCNLHRGKSLAGIAPPSFKTGRHSRYLPTRMLEDLREAVNDPDYLSPRAEIALVDARIADLMRSAKTGESAALWQTSADLAHKAKVAPGKAGTAETEAARAKWDGVQQEAVQGIVAAWQEGGTDSLIWREIIAMIDLRRKLCETEAKRIALAHSTMNVEQVNAFLEAIVMAVKRNVANRGIAGHNGRPEAHTGQSDG